MFAAEALRAKTNLFNTTEKSPINKIVEQNFENLFYFCKTCDLDLSCYHDISSRSRKRRRKAVARCLKTTITKNWFTDWNAKQKWSSKRKWTWLVKNDIGET